MNANNSHTPDLMLQKLDQISKLAEGSKVSRFLNSPLKYANGIFYRHLIYPKTKKGKFVTCNTFFGFPMQVALPAGMDIYLLEAKSHDSEIRLAKLITRVLKPGQTFIDIGAHFGYFSLLASKIVGEKGRVVSIEASKEIGKILKNNVADHENIEVKYAACSDKPEEISFYEFPVLFSEYNTTAPDQFTGSDWINENKPTKNTIQAITADGLVKQLHLKPDFIKIDVEGAEDKVIAGMAETLKSNKNLIISMEFLEDERHNKAHIQAAKQLAALGFQSHIITKTGELEPIDVNEITTFYKKHHIQSDNIVFKSN